MEGQMNALRQTATIGVVLATWVSVTLIVGQWLGMTLP